MENDHNQIRVAKYIYDAANQLKYMIPWAHDCRNKQDNIKVFYSIDADIIPLFTNPILTQQYGRVFHSDDTKTTLSIARALGYYIISELSIGQGALFVFPQTAIEIQRMYYAVALKAENEYRHVMKTKKIEEVDEYLRKFKDFNNDVEVNKFIEKFEQILNIVADIEGSATAELEKFSNLLVGRHIGTPDYFLSDKLALNKSPVKNLINCYTKIDNNKLQCLADTWFDRLIKNSPAKKQESEINSDAEVLACLELLNEDLREKESYLVFITGSSSILNASYKYFPSDKNHISFGEMYIRHPRSFLSEPGLQLFKGDGSYATTDYMDQSEINLIEWLDVLLTPLGDLKKLFELDANALNPIAADLLSNENSAFLDLETEWKAFTKVLEINGWLKSRKTMLLKAFRDIQKRLETNRVQDILAKKAKKAWDDFFNIALDGGHGLILSPSRASFPSRSVPVLRLTHFPSTQDYVNTIFKRSGKLKTKTLTKQEKRLLNKLREEDISGYSYHLAVGLFFFSVGQWRVANILAKRARAIAERQYNDKIILGNEALYLVAISSRLIAKSSRDLIHIKPQIKEAYKRLRRAINDDTFIDRRYESELCAFQLTYHMFRLFRKEPLDTNILELEGIQKELLRLLALENKKELANIKLKTERQILANLFQIFLLRKYYVKDSFTEPSNIVPLIKKFKKNIEYKDTEKLLAPAVSFRIQVIFLVSTYCFYPKSDKEKNRNQIYRLMTDHKIKEASILPYDKDRYKFYKSICI